MVGVDVGFERPYEPQAQLADQGSIASRLLEDRVDEQRLRALAVAEEVGVGGGLRVSVA
jgi:hypothetical protein